MQLRLLSPRSRPFYVFETETKQWRDRDLIEKKNFFEIEIFY